MCVNCTQTRPVESYMERRSTETRGRAANGKVYVKRIVWRGDGGHDLRLNRMI